MAANMQHMAGAAGMMQQQRARPSQVQLNQFLYNTMIAQPQPHSGWQAGVQMQERMVKCHNLITNIALAITNIDIMKAAEVGVNFEREAFNKSADKAQYETQMSNKTNEFFRRRQANEQNLSNNIQAQAAAQAQQQLMMNQNAAMQNQMGRGMGQNPQQGFQHLQHQMQASQIPQQVSMGINMGGQGGQGGQPIGPNQQMFQMPGGQARPQNAVPSDPSSLTPADQQKVMELAQKMAAACPEPQKNHYRGVVQARFAQRAQEFTAQGKDPVLIWFQHQAFQGLAKNIALQRQRQAQGGMPPNMNPAQAQAMMQGRGQMNPAMMNAGGVQGSNGDFGQFNAMESIINQQKAGILAQEQGQMVVPASNGPARNATPQPIAGGQGQGMPNQAGPNQTPRPPQAQNQFQQAQQLKMEQQQSQHAAQMRAQQAARQLQGQPNGLGGAPPSQSPGMNTLNTPMRRPPSAMNPMEGQGGAQANGPFAGTLDPRFNQGNQRPMSTGGNMNMANNPVFHNMMASMSQEQRQAVNGLPPDKLHEVMAKWQEQQRKMQQMSAMQQAGNNPGQMQGRPGQLGQFGMSNAANQFMANGMMQQPGQGTPNQQVMAQQQQILARLRNQATPVAPQHLIMMDSMDLPLAVINQIGPQLRFPPDLRKWKDLKQWLAQNPINPSLHQHLEKVQRSQFATLMTRQMDRRNAQAQQQAQQQGQPQQSQQPPQQQPQQQPQQPHQQQSAQPQQPQNQPPAQGQPQQNGMQAGNVASNQQGPNQPPGMQNLPPTHLITVTPLDIMNARKANPKIANLTDDQLRQFIIQIKQRQMAAAMQKDMAMRQAQAQAAAQNMGGQGQQNVPVSAPQQPQPPMAQPGGPQSNATAPTPTQASQPAPPKQQSATPDPKAVANAAASRNNNRPAPNNQQQPPNPSPATAQKSLKRPSTDDAIDVPRTAAQQQPSRPPPKMPNLTPEQIASMTPEQKAKYEVFKSRLAASASAASATDGDFEKLRRIGQEEQRAMTAEHMPDIPMTPEQRQETAEKLSKIVVDMGKIGKALGRWYAATHDDVRAKSYFRARLRMIRQFTDGEQMSNPKPVFSVRPTEIDETRRLLESMARDCASLGKRNAAAPPQPGGPSASPNQAAAASTQGGQPAPLSAANLEKQTQALNKMHNRSNSKSGAPPAAPTTSQPPFPFGATSPHGQPAYIGKPKVSRDNLTLPPRKKTKTETPPQPSQATPSPQISKSGSPELKRQPAPESKPLPKPMFLCPEADCEMASIGFPSDQLRQAHIQEEHVKPLEDPMKFMQENLALTLGLDINGQMKAEPQTTTQPMGQNPSKQGQTPVSNAAATPMSRDASMQRTGSKMGGKLPDTKPVIAKTEGTPKLDNKQPEPAAAPPAPMDPWANTIDPQSLFTNLGKFELGAGGTISDMGVYRSLTPNDTPESSKDSGSSEPNSDISEGVHLDIDVNWQPVDVDLLLDMDSINMGGLGSAPDGGAEFDALMLDDTMPMEQFPNWDEVTNDFNKPFQFDNSLYSLDVSSSL